MGHCHSAEHRMVQVIVERRRRVSHKRKGCTTDVLMQWKMRLLLLLMDVMLLETLLLRMLRIVLVRMLLVLMVVIV